MENDQKKKERRTLAMSRQEVLGRYGRQMLLPAIGSEGQAVMMSKRVLVVGAGGIGSTVLMYLAAAGVSVAVMDHDSVDPSNLHRQVIHADDSEGHNKAQSAVTRLQQLNPTVRFTAIEDKLTTFNALAILSEFDVVVDATDNFEARYVLNDACVLLRRPLVSASAVGWEAQITVFVPSVTACYRCLFPSPSMAEMCRSCANAGVVGPVPGMIGCWEAIETLKLLLQLSPSPSLPSSSAISSLTGRQLFFDCAVGESFVFDLPTRSMDCAVCGESPSITSLTHTESLLQSIRDKATEEAKCYVGTSSDEHFLSPLEYSKGFVNSERCHMLLDVRSDVQFSLTNFASAYPHRYTTHTLTEVDRIAQGPSILLHVPLARLAVELPRLDAFFTALCNKHPCPEPETSSVSIVVLCRRGIDSQVATAMLRKHNPQWTVLNLKGGLCAWQQQVDDRFPMY